jgi:hypothetical protein
MSDVWATAGGTVSRRRVWKWGLAAAAAPAVVVPSGAQAATRAKPGFLALAAEPGTLMVGTIVRNRSGAVVSAAVVWPDGVGGTFVADEIDESTGAVNAYHVTYGVSRRYVQPRVSRDRSGRVVHRPAIRVE